MVLSLALNLSDELAGANIQVALLGLTLFGVLLLGGELWDSVLASWRERRVSLESLFALAFTGGLTASLVGLATDGPVFFEVVTVVLCIHALGRRLRGRFWASAMAKIDQAGLLPSTAQCERDGALVEVPSSELVQDDLVAVFEGARAPASGRVERGRALVDTGDVDGGLVPQWLGPGDHLIAGAAVRGGTVRVRVTAAGSHELTRTRDALLSAYAAPAPHGAVELMARLFVPVVAGIAVIAGLVWAVLAGPAQGFTVASSVLLVACPCGLGLATPVATWAVAAQLGARGIRVQRPAALEVLGRVEHVVLDKTGTVTQLALTEPVPESVAALVSSVQRWFDHPIARLVHALAVPDLAVRDPHRLAAGGVSAQVYVDDDWRTVSLHPQGAGRRDVEVQLDGRVRAVLRVEERLVDSAVGAVAALGKLGVGVNLLSGDHRNPGLDVPWRGGATPADKASALREQSGPVAFVGDQPNDLPALAQADVAIAVASGSDLVVEAADLVVDDLDALSLAMSRARQLRRRLRRLLSLSALGNTIGIGLAIVGLLHPVVAAIIMLATSLSVTLLAVPPEES